MLRLVADHVSTNEHVNALSLEVQMDVAARLGPIFCAPLDEPPPPPPRVLARCSAPRWRLRV